MKLLRALLLGIFLCIGSGVFAQEPYKVTEKFFPKPYGIEISTPGCLRASQDEPFAPTFTTYDELLSVMKKCKTARPEWVSKEIIGTSQNGTPIPAWKISNPAEKGEKLKVLYMGRIHGDEPAGTEALLYFAQQLCAKPELQSLLKQIDFYLIPMVNVDGAAANRRRATNKMDLNRDQSTLISPESHALQSYVHKIQPQVAVDFHEYYAANSRYSSVVSDTLSLPWDVMTSCTKNRNVPLAIRTISADKFESAIDVLCNKMHWQHSFYVSSEMEDGKLVFSMGGVYPTTTTAVLPLQNILSFIVETRRTSAHNRSLERRAWIAYSMAVEFARISAVQSTAIRSALAQAQEDTRDIVVRYVSKKAEPVSYRFLNMNKAEYQNVEVLLRDIRNAAPKLTRSFPKGYYVLPGQTELQAQLDRQNIQYSVLNAPVSESVEAYHVTKFTLPQKLAEVNIQKQQIDLPAGTLYIPLQQPKARWITLMMEPEAYQSYVVRGLVSCQEGAELPYYRK